jgi:hypothetical protein
MGLSTLFGVLIAHGPVQAQTLVTSGTSASSDGTRAQLTHAAGSKLRAAYPDHIDRIENGQLVWRDGTRMPIDDGAAPKPFDGWLQRPDLKDMFRLQYPAGAPPSPPPMESDPGRARNASFFHKMYGDCRKQDFVSQLVDVAWLPSRSQITLRVTKINGVAEKLAAISAELDALPASFNSYLLPHDRRHRSDERAQLRHRRRYRYQAGALLAVVKAERGRAAAVAQPDPDGDRPHLRASRLYLGWPLASLRYDAL